MGTAWKGRGLTCDMEYPLERPTRDMGIVFQGKRLTSDMGTVWKGRGLISDMVKAAD